jgi:BlaI family penicillinase repressor
MAEVPGISESEWEVMGVLWERAPLTAQQVIARLAGKKQWNQRTVRTFLNRLVKKGALKFEAQGNRYLYRPAVTRDRCVREESESFLSRVFAGATGAMLVQFVEQARLTPAEVEELQKVLAKKKA